MPLIAPLELWMALVWAVPAALVGAAFLLGGSGLAALGIGLAAGLSLSGSI